MDSPQPTLQVRDLTVSYRLGQAWHAAVRDFSLTVERGQTYGLVGESGSGKSTLALAVMGYLDPAARVDSGQVVLEGQDLLGVDRPALRAVWGRRLGFVPQDPQPAVPDP